ncbi:MAG TPA: peptidylprolyl isomerase, partial [Gemmatimonadaceae bacterium]|nr:peptidylprolyl isomerase [Gemmatimonadaceae bacterium]
MWILILPLLMQQVPVERSVLEAEHARASGAAALVAQTTTGTPRLRALAARGLGRMEDTAQARHVLPLLASPSIAVRVAAAGALAQMRAPFTYDDRLTDRDASVRAALYEAAGRAAPATDDAERALVRGLADSAVPARVGAARGLESFFRLNRRTRGTAAAPTLEALHAAFASTRDPMLRQLVLMTMLTVRDRDSVTLARGLADASPLVRRLAVAGAQRHVQDTSALVRAEAVRHGDCAQIAPALSDDSDQVVLAAIGAVQQRRCPVTLLQPLLTSGRNGEQRGQALLALAALDTVAARGAVAAVARDSSWQARMAAADVATKLGDTVTMQILATDANPNVIAAAIHRPADLVAALRSEHAGVLLAVAAKLKGMPDLSRHQARLVSAFNRLTADGSMTLRDPRVALLTRIGELPDTTTNGLLRDALQDRDPAVAAVASQLLTARTGTRVAPATTTLPIPPIPPASYIAGLAGAQARVTMKGLGTMTLELLTDEAPVTVAVFAQLAESRQYDGLTFHRIVPNFVLQGGSPGADEYDPRTREFMRDELGTASNVRGSIGVSTRGRDTGDGQIYINLIDNFRLDHDYTVFARTLRGLDVIDRI